MLGFLEDKSMVGHACSCCKSLACLDSELRSKSWISMSEDSWKIVCCML